ncbi:isochorismatase family protein [Brevundimonas vesicularis]
MLTERVPFDGGTNVCVLSTVLGAIDLGYRIVVVSDGALQFG